MAPKLARVQLHPNTFQKMRVSNSKWVMSSSCAAAIKFLAEEKSDETLLTTAWFLEKADEWFEILSSTNSFKGLSRTNFDEKSKVLGDFMTIIRSKSFFNEL